MVFVVCNPGRADFLLNHGYNCIQNGERSCTRSSLPIATINLFSTFLLHVLSFTEYVENLREVEYDAVVDGERIKLKSNQWDRAVKEPNNIEEARRNLLGHYDCAVVICWITLTFNVPILDSSDDVALIKHAQHDFDFVS